MDYIKKRSKSINSYSYSPQLSNKSAINVLPSDQMIKLNSKRSSCCRVIILQKNRTGSYGFTLQTYAFKHHKTERAELLTYVDFVEVGGPAFRGGMKRGDVIMSINDKSIEGLQHEQLVQFIKQSPSPLRLTVTNEDWCTRIDLNLKKLKLKQRLKEKYLELNRLERLEKELLRKAGLWCQKEASNECCSSDLSTSDPLSPFSSKRASFMCTSVDVLRDAGLVCNPNRDASGEAAEDLFRKSLLTRSDCNKMEKQHGRSYESHSLPIVRKKKHFLQNQVFSVCENVVKMGCFSRSSVDVDSSSVDDVALVCDFDCKTAPERDSSRTNLREQSKTWYGVPEMHRAALLKKQRKTSEASTKWYFSVFDDEDFAAPSKSGFDSSTSKSLDSVEGGTRSERNQIVESLPNRSFVPAKSTNESSLEVLPLSTPALECNHLQVGEDFERRRLRSTRSSEEARSSCSIPASNAGAFEDLSFESQEFMNSLPSTCSPAPDEDDRRRCLQEIRSRLDACRSIKTQLSLHESSDCDTHL